MMRTFLSIVIAGSIISGAVFLFITKNKIASQFPPREPQMHWHSHQPFNLHQFWECKSLIIFGDSTVDSGTSDITQYPYGVDFNEGPRVGRFSNGKTSADYLASWMLKSIPVPFKNNTNMLPDVPISFASGGCGLLNYTDPPIPFKCFSFREQVDQFLNVKSLSIAANDLFFFSIGNNDFLLSSQFDIKTPPVFAKEMTSEYITYLQRLHSFGARKFLVNNIGPLGCIPDKRIPPDSKCNEEINAAVQVFNANLIEALKNFVKDFGAEVVLADSDVLFSRFLEDPSKYGFKFTEQPCCGTWSKALKRFECTKESNLCEDRNIYIFFDGAHPTERANFYFFHDCIYGNICKPIIVTD